VNKNAKVSAKGVCLYKKQRRHGGNHVFFANIPLLPADDNSNCFFILTYFFKIASNF